MKYCPNCASPDIVRDAWVDANDTTSVTDIFDDHFCQDCETTFKVPATEEQAKEIRLHKLIQSQISFGEIIGHK